MMGSSFALTSSDFGTSMPNKSQEESISSLKLTRSAMAQMARPSQLIWNDRCQAYRERVVAVSVVSVSFRAYVDVVLLGDRRRR
jgi:hypothetical protein